MLLPAPLNDRFGAIRFRSAEVLMLADSHRSEVDGEAIVLAATKRTSRWTQLNGSKRPLWRALHKGRLPVPTNARSPAI